MQLILTTTDQSPVTSKWYNLMIREHEHWFPTELHSKPVSQTLDK